MGSIQVAMLGMNYQRPNERDGCHSCTHYRTEGAQFSGSVHRTCTKGGFYVAPLGICSHHQPKANAPAGDQS